jgi:hypothetical protein
MRYFVPEPELEPEPMLPLEPLPVLPVPVLGAVGAGAVVELLEPLPGVPEVLPEVLPLVPPAAPELDLKWASHSEREIVPSLLLSTDEKVGVEVLAPAALLPDMPLEPLVDEPLEPVEPEADGVEVEGLVVELPLVPEELCATATLEIASSAAAVAALRSLRLSIR